MIDFKDMSLVYSLFQCELDYVESVLNQVHSNNDTIIEIGAFQGRTSAFLGNYAKNKGGNIVSIDSWTLSDDRLSNSEFNVFSSYTQNLPVTYIRDNYENVDVSQFNNVSVVLLDIDGSEQNITDALEKYYPVVKEYGAIIVHHYFGSNWRYNVRPAITKFINNYNVSDENYELVTLEETNQDIIKKSLRSQLGGFCLIIKK